MSPEYNKALDGENTAAEESETGRNGAPIERTSPTPGDAASGRDFLRKVVPEAREPTVGG